MNDRPRRSLSTSRLSFPRGRTEASGRRHKPDYWILILSALLLTIGLVVVYSISPGLAASQHVSQNYFVTKQLIDVALGIITFAIASYLPLDFWKRIMKPLVVVTLIGCLVAAVTPVNVLYPAHRWIRLGSFSFQIAELIKLALLIWAAGFLAQKWREGKLAESKTTLQPLVLLLIGVGVVVAKLQSDLGSAAVIAAMLGMMAFTAGIPLKKIAMIAGLVVVLAAIAISSSAYRRERLTTFLHPETNCQSSGYQSCQDLISIGSGGLFGLGLGHSVQAYGYTPEASNDSIFAIMAEEFGFIGTLMIVVLYGLFISRLKRVIERTADQFKRLIVVGVLAWLSTQMIINVGAMVGLLPLKGITLPLISQGGTSLVFLTAALGIVFQISRYTSYNITEPDSVNYETNNNYHSTERRGIGRSYNPSLTTRPRT